MILDLVRAGKKVGVTSNSHKVIGNVLEGRHQGASRRRNRPHPPKGQGGRGLRPSSRRSEPTRTSEVADGLAANCSTLRPARPGYGRMTDLANSVDTLFVDEAGQVSLANVVAMSGPLATSSCSATRSSSTSRPRECTRMAPASPRSATFSATTRRCRRPRRLPGERRGGCIRQSRRTRPTFSTRTS